MSRFAYTSPIMALSSVLLFAVNIFFLFKVLAISHLQSTELFEAESVTKAAEPGIEIIGQSTQGSGADQPSDMILKRPLFYFSRRPFQPLLPPASPVKQVIETPADQTPTYKLYGVIIEGLQSKALLQSDSNTGAEWVAIGEALEGCNLVIVTPDAVVLERGDKKISLDLYPDRLN